MKNIHLISRIKILISSFILFVLLYIPTLFQKINQIAYKKTVPNPNNKKQAAINRACLHKEYKKNDYLFVDCTGFFE